MKKIGSKKTPRSRPAKPPLAVLLLSGGLDSATAGAWARQRMGWRLEALTVRYGQRHLAEVQASRRVARLLGVEHQTEIRVDLGRIGGSALTDPSIPVPKGRSGAAIRGSIPITYVPARNTVFLSLALGLAETLGANDIVIGVNALDYSGYPDCRPAFIRAFERLAQTATKVGVEGHTRIRIHTPLLKLTKAEIIKLGTRLGVDYGLTCSCYDPIMKARKILACGQCDACLLRKNGFEEAGIKDPVPYRQTGRRPQPRVHSPPN